MAELLRARGWTVVWLGTRQGMESRLIPAAGIEVEWLSVAGLRGKGVLGVLSGVPRLAIALLQALRAVWRRHPAVVLGFGGFAAFPGGLAAALLRRPLLIHEQNAIAGLSNRVLALLARRVLTGFPTAFRERGSNPLARWLPQPSRTEWVGNPVRAALSMLPSPAERFAGRSGPLRVLVIGGSQGARALNTLLPQAVALLPRHQRPHLLHQSGAKLFDAMRDAYTTVGVDAEVQPFIEDMAAALASADVVVCRSGALTVAELAAVGVGSGLVPFPAAVDDHQTWNARVLCDVGAAILFPQEELDARRLADWLASLDRATLLTMAQAAHALARPDAAAVVAQRAEELAGQALPGGH